MSEHEECADCAVDAVTTCDECGSELCDDCYRNGEGLCVDCQQSAAAEAQGLTFNEKMGGNS
jgi:hypothetical protein